MPGLFKFLCFKYNLSNTLHVSDVQEPDGLTAFECFLLCWQLPALTEHPLLRGAWSTEQTWLSWPCSSCGWNCQPLFVAHIGRSCSMACAPTSQSFGAVWAVQVSAAPAGSSCAPVFITPLRVCVEFNFCWRTKLQYLPINYQDFALRIFVVDKCCLKYQNIQEDYISFIYMYL